MKDIIRQIMTGPGKLNLATAALYKNNHGLVREVISEILFSEYHTVVYRT